MRPFVRAACVAGITILLVCADARAAWHTFRRDAGLAGNQVHWILEARTGEFWFAGDQGAAVSDGVNWDRVLTGITVNRILEDSHGGLWFATLRGGVHRKRGTEWTPFTRATTHDSLADDSVADLLETSDGAMWFGTYAAGAFRYRDGTWRQVASPRLRSNSVEAMAEDDSGFVWLGTSAGLTRLDANWTPTHFTSAGPLPADSVHALFRAGSALWVGTSNGVVRWDGGAFLPVRRGIDVRAITQGADGSLWFGTPDGTFRYDGRAWLRFGVAEGVAANRVLSAAADGHGNIWIGTNNGVSRFDGQRASRFVDAARGPDRVAPADTVLAADSVVTIAVDSSNRTWIGTIGGISRFDAMGWHTFTSSDSLPSDRIRAVLAVPDGSIWIATTRGVVRVDGGGWRAFGAADGIPSEDITALAVHPGGGVLAASNSGVRHFAAGVWQSVPVTPVIPRVQSLAMEPGGKLWIGAVSGLYQCVAGTCTRFVPHNPQPPAVNALSFEAGALWVGDAAGVAEIRNGALQRVEGAPPGRVSSLARGADGSLWAGAVPGGAGRFDGSGWQLFGLDAGLGSTSVLAMAPSADGSTWLGTLSGATLLEPDRASPVVAVLSRPPVLSAARLQRIVYVAGFDEDPGFQGSFSDSEVTWSAWSDWSAVTTWNGDVLRDGAHAVRVRGRDLWGNICELPPVRFEIDATPPAPVIAAPAFGAPVRNAVAIVGTTADTRLKNWTLEAGPSGAGTWTELRASVASTSADTLAVWDTGALEDGLYDLRLTVRDSLDLSGAVRITVQVDNHEPFAGQTTPVAVRRDAAAHAYSIRGDIHAYFPPYSFDQDAVVDISARDPQGSQPPGEVLSAFDVSWGAARLVHPATVDVEAGAAGVATLWMRPPGGEWSALGGTKTGTRIVAPLREPGSLALVSGTGAGGSTPRLSAVNVAPRVLVATGQFASDAVAVHFRLGQPGPVSIRLYNAAGRLVRTIASGVVMQAGANSVAWDGRDDGGRRVLSGPYLVHVRANGAEQTATLVAQ